MTAVSRVDIAFVHPSIPPYRLALFNTLSHCEDIHFIFTFRQGDAYKYWDERDAASMFEGRYSYITAGLRLGFNGIRPIYRRLAELAPQVVISSEFNAQTIQALLYVRSRRGVGHVIMTDLSLETAIALGRSRAFVRKQLVPYANSVIVCSNSGRELMIQSGVDQTRLFVSRILTDEEHVLRSAASFQVDSRRSELQLGTKSVVLFVGRLEEQKNVGTLMKAFAGLLRRLPDSVVLIIVGDGTERPKLEAEAEKLGVCDHVRFVGFCPPNEVFAYYQIASVFVLPSIWEPFGAVVNEALLMGVPVVCSRVAGSSDLIHDGINGYLVRPDSADAIASAIEQILMGKLTHGQKRGKSLMLHSFQAQVDEFRKAIGFAREDARDL